MTVEASASTPPLLQTPGRRLRLFDLALVAAFSAILFGYAMFSGRPLSLHSARLPECAREMMRTGDWLIPRSGGRPWLERPPLPHWITIAVSAALGQHCDSEWVVRLPAALAGTFTVLMTAWIGAALFDRRVGLCSGFVLATAFEFYHYSTLPEDDIFLAAVVVAAMAMFVKANFREPAASDSRVSFFTTRPWPVLAFFVLLGLTNLAKGPLVGAAVLLASIGAFLLWNAEPRAIRRYVWLWGGVIFVALTLFWPYEIHRRYPSTVDNWLFDYSGTTQYDEPPWYYVIQLPGVFMPWTPAALVGLWLTWNRAKSGNGSAERFLWCWALMPVLILSIPHRKHHHYLVPSLAPWAIVAAIGLERIAKWLFSAPERNRRPIIGVTLIGVPIAVAIVLLHWKIPGPFMVTIGLAFIWLACVTGFYVGLHRQLRMLTMGSVVLGLVMGYCWGVRYLPDETADDTAFLRRVNAITPFDIPLMINADLNGENGPHGEMDFFRNQFYVRPSAALLHNLTFLRDERIYVPEVYVITRASDRTKLETLGQVEIIVASERTRREKYPDPSFRFVLFRLRFRPDLQRYPAPLADSITTMQAMGRAEGPWCGPAF